MRFTGCSELQPLFPLTVFNQLRASPSGTVGQSDDEHGLWSQPIWVGVHTSHLVTGQPWASYLTFLYVYFSSVQ